MGYLGAIRKSPWETLGLRLDNINLFIPLNGSRYKNNPSQKLNWTPLISFYIYKLRVNILWQIDISNTGFIQSNCLLWYNVVMPWGWLAVNFYRSAMSHLIAIAIMFQWLSWGWLTWSIGYIGYHLMGVVLKPRKLSSETHPIIHHCYRFGIVLSQIYR